jgi:hypothetical protein
MREKEMEQRRKIIETSDKKKRITEERCDKRTPK